MSYLIADTSSFANFSTMATIGGTIFAAGYFIYKLCTGWLMLNLNLSVKVERLKDTTNKDHLAILVRLEKGDRETLYPTDIQARITPLGADGIPDYDNPKICRILGHEAVEESYEGCIYWHTSPKQMKKMPQRCKCSFGTLERTPPRPIRMGPGEVSEFGGYMQVDSDRVYLVEVAYVAHHWLYRAYMNSNAQWRASTISLPNKKKESTE